MAEQGAAGLAALAQRLDTSLGLDEQGYVQVLEIAGDAAALQQVNVGAGAAAPCVVVLAGAAAVTVPSLIEQHLIAAGRQGVIVVLPESQQEHKKRRTSSLPDGISYEGNSFAGRVNFLPSAAELPLIGKRTSAWRRLQGGQQTHKIAAHEVRRVVPHPAPTAALAVAAVQVAADGTAEVQTAAPHPFSGAKQLASLEGLPGGLDGHHPIAASDRRKSQLVIRIKLPRLDADAAAALQHAVAGGGVTVSERYILDDSFALLHFMLAGEGAPAAAAAPPGAQAAAVAAAAAAAAGGPAAGAAPAAAAAAAAAEEAALLPLLVGPVGFGALEAALHVPGLVPELGLGLLPEMPLHPDDMPGGPDLAAMQLDAGAAGDALLGAQLGPLFFQQEEQQQQQQQQQQQAPQQAQQAVGGGLQPGPPAAGAGPAAAHVASGGHFRLLTVGGEQPVAGGPLFPGKALVVRSGAEVEGALKVGSLEQVSDARAKERVREIVLAEGKRALDLATSITCVVFRYKGEEAQHLGVIAQQVEAALQEFGVSDLGIVRRSAQGQLSLDVTGLVTLLLSSVQDLAGDMRELREQLAVLSLAAAGALQETAAASQAAAAGGGGPAGVASVHGLGGGAGAGTGGGSLQRAASSSSSLSQLLDSGDVEMEGSSSADEAQQAQQAQQAAGQAAGRAAAGGEGEFAGLSDEAVALWLQQRLEPSNPHMRKKFEKLACQLSRAALWQVYRETVSQPTELTAQGDRQRTLGGQFAKAAGRRAVEEEVRRKAASAPPPPKSLRGYQQRLLQAAQQGGNCIIVAPTGSGKTDVAVAYAVHVLQRDHSARVVFLAPTVALAEQQAGKSTPIGFFLAAPTFSSGTFRVACRAGDNTLQPPDWSRVVKECHVLVMTPQTFLNALKSGHAHIDDLALLVVDECHHAQADHPTACILREWHKSSQRTQILGLTASPAAKASLAATYEALAKLAANLGARYLVLNDSDPEVQAVVPEVAHEEILVELAQQDAACAACLGGFAVAAVAQLRPLLPGKPGGTHFSIAASSVADLPAEVLAMLAAGRWTATAVRWTMAAADALRAAAHPGSSTAAEGPQTPPASAGTAGASEAATALPTAVHDLRHALLLVKAAVASLALVSDVGFEAALRHLSKEYFAVAAKVAAAPTADGAAADTSAAPAADGPHAVTAALLAQLAEAVDRAGVLPGAFSAEGGVLGRHPKFQALVAFLRRYSSQPAFHGIVFTRTREGARSITQLLAAAPGMEGVQVYCFMGHGGRSSCTGDTGGTGGMTSKQQQAVMADFRQPGRRLLVSTAAGEEGIDVPRCEFVVRYTATQTGRERVQSAGRARKFGSCFVEIIEASREELSLIRKSRTEEANMRAAVRALGALGLAS